MNSAVSTKPILPIKRSVSIDTMINREDDGHGDGDGMSKQTLRAYSHRTKAKTKTPKRKLQNVTKIAFAVARCDWTLSLKTHLVLFVQN